MALVEVAPPASDAPIPPRLAEFIREAEQRITRYIDDLPGVPTVAFVPSDFAAAYSALVHITEYQLAPGACFLEWGAGFAVVASLAHAIGLDAHGIEIDATLVANSRTLAADFNLSPNLVEGSFVPVGGDRYTEDSHSEHAWLASGGPDGYDAIGLEPDDFDIIYAYPWPGEESIVERLFDRYAAAGALLVTYRGREGVRIQRKKPIRGALRR
jgi:hypothetical protein